MNDASILWYAFTGLVSILGTTLWLLARYFINKLEKLSESKTASDLSAFLSKDEAREDGWTTWREDRVERTLENHEERLRSHTASIARIEGRMNGSYK